MPTQFPRKSPQPDLWGPSHQEYYLYIIYQEVRESNEQEKSNELGRGRPEIRLRSAIAYALDFAYALANHRPEIKLDRSLSRTAARILTMSHQMSKSYETLSCPSDFHDTLLAHVTFYFNCTPYLNYLVFERRIFIFRIIIILR